MSTERITINRETWARAGRAIKAFASSEVGGSARWHALGLGVLLFVTNGLNVVASYVGRDFMTAIEQQSVSEFWRYAGLYLGVFALLTVTAVLYRFAEESLGLLWRVWLSSRLSEFYLEHLNYYTLKERKTVDNPDQRIADDVRVFTATTLSFVLMLLNGTFTIVAFSGVLWSINPWLFTVAVGYAALGSLLTIVLGRPLVWLSYQQSDREAALRAELVHVRENAETIAISRREGRLAQRLALRIDELGTNARKMIAVNRNLGFFTTGYNWLIQIIPALIVAPSFMRGEVEFGVISQSAIAFTQLVGAFSLIITQFQSISSYAATVARLSALAEAMEHPTAPSSAAIEIVDAAPAPAAGMANGERSVRYEHLTLRSPRRGRVLVDALDATIVEGDCVLVTSADELALVALFRASAGIWDYGEGRILRPSVDEILFVPERPYLPPGTLRDVVVRAGREGQVTDAVIETALQALGVEALVARNGGYDTEQDWDSVLSLREQQLLAIARVLLAAPRFVYFDRLLTTLTPEDGQRAFAALLSRSIGHVVFGGANGLAAHCGSVLHIAADGKWQWTKRDLGRASA